jgi:hypothetical protein
MALAARPSRRRAGSQRWLVVPFVVTIVVFLLDASMHARSPQPERTLAAQTWIDQVLPDIAQSSEQGQQLINLRTAGLGMSATTITGQLNSIAAQTRSTYQAVTKITPSASVASAAGMLDAALLSRQEAASAFAGAVSSALEGTPATKAVTGITTAVADMQVGDQAYRLFVKSLPSLGVTLPASVWLTDPSPFQPSIATVYLQTLQSATSLAPDHNVAVEAISTDPGPVSADGSTQVLLPATTISVQVDVADIGNQPERNVTVQATVTPAATGASQTVKSVLNLTSGQASAVTLSGLRPQVGLPVTLTVQALPASGVTGGTTDNTRTITIELPGKTPPTSSTTSTTVPVTTLATLPSSGTTTASVTTPLTTTPASTGTTTGTTTPVRTTAPPTTVTRTTVATTVVTTAPTTSPTTTPATTKAPTSSPSTS